MGILLIDKPKGLTSFDVCFKLRTIFNTKKIGHTGTLDPNASGLMMVLIGKDVKANQFLVSCKKEYKAEVKIGVLTKSGDIVGEILETKKEIMPSFSQIKEVLNSFIGKSIQTPPMTSAIKVRGKKLYQYQLENIDIEIPKREIEIFEIELLEVKEDTFVFRAVVSSGTYIRSLANDVLNKLGIIGTLNNLTRTKIDNFDLSDADRLNDVLNNNYHEYNALEVLSHYYKVINLRDADRIIRGLPTNFNCDDEMVLLAFDNQAIAIYKRDNDIYRCVRGLF